MIVSNEQTLDQEQRRREEDVLLAQGEQELIYAKHDGADADMLLWIEQNKHRGRIYLQRARPVRMRASSEYQYRDLTPWGSDLRDGEEAMGRDYATRQAISDAQGRK